MNRKIIIGLIILVVACAAYKFHRHVELPTVGDSVVIQTTSCSAYAERCSTTNTTKACCKGYTCSSSRINPSSGIGKCVPNNTTE